MQARHIENLFRQNAIDSLATALDGQPVAIMPKAWIRLSAFCAAFVVCASVFMSQVEYARKETVRGWLVAEPGVIRLAHDDFATVTLIERKAGEVVRRGDRVVQLSAGVTLDSGEDAVLLALESLQEQLTGVEAREKLTREQFGMDHRDFDNQLQGIKEEISALERQQSEQARRVRYFFERVDDMRSAFERGAIAKIEMLQQQDELAAMRQAAARLGQERTSLDRKHETLLASQERLGVEFERELALLARERSELRRRIAGQDEQRSVTVRSPIDGTLATLDVVAGGTVRPQQLLATVVPGQSSLVADVYVPSRAVGMVRPGQVVRLLYDAFPQQQFGAAQGEVAAIAGFVSLPGEMPGAAGQREASYKVRIRIADDHVQDEQGRFALRPGMALAAEIILESRSLADWFLGPLRARL